ncbi:hypothetical protein [Oscillatoria acuminata]|uniref:Uncharacterized protein n=1 Tax=Oscillatoria acuminata PCC 6304 TaxID=56110 RepID=K9TCX6_9CYAN|nr:hypothetical protein [Oscillatoria acuminata]AFY79991.1 hypothetical protein Oscil6304_0238 [Oscillatoria acuminata PCC 6304]
MNVISQIAKQALATGYLTLEAEERLRLLLQQTEYGLEDFQAFMLLQKEAMKGRVRQESRELWRSHQHITAAV